MGGQGCGDVVDKGGVVRRGLAAVGRVNHWPEMFTATDSSAKPWRCQSASWLSACPTLWCRRPEWAGPFGRARTRWVIGCRRPAAVLRQQPRPRQAVRLPRGPADGDHQPFPGPALERVQHRFAGRGSRPCTAATAPPSVCLDWTIAAEISGSSNRSARPPRTSIVHSWWSRRAGLYAVARTRGRVTLEELAAVLERGWHWTEPAPCCRARGCHSTCPAVQLPYTTTEQRRRPGPGEPS